jgi:hypothetical protein
VRVYQAIVVLALIFGFGVKLFPSPSVGVIPIKTDVLSIIVSSAQEN